MRTNETLPILVIKRHRPLIHKQFGMINHVWNDASCIQSRGKHLIREPVVPLTTCASENIEKLREFSQFSSGHKKITWNFNQKQEEFSSALSEKIRLLRSKGHKYYE